MNGTPPTGDSKLKSFMLGALAGLPMVMWMCFVLIAGLADHSSTEPARVDSTLRLVGVASGSALAVIAGSFLGIKNAQGQTMGAALFRRPRLSVNGWVTLAYFAGLLLAVILWALDGDRAQADEVIQTAIATLFGFGIGALKAVTTPPA